MKSLKANPCRCFAGLSSSPGAKLRPNTVSFSTCRRRTDFPAFVSRAKISEGGLGCALLLPRKLRAVLTLSSRSFSGLLFKRLVDARGKFQQVSLWAAAFSMTMIMMMRAVGVCVCVYCTVHKLRIPREKRENARGAPGKWWIHKLRKSRRQDSEPPTIVALMRCKSLREKGERPFCSRLRNMNALLWVFALHVGGGGGTVKCVMFMS